LTSCQRGYIIDTIHEVLLLLLGTAESAQFLMLRAQHFVAVPSLLLLKPTCNQNTHEKGANIEKTMI
jgi:hypothetical protein